MNDDSAPVLCRCGSDNIRPSLYRNWREWLVRYLFPLRYYRCRDCGWRGAMVNADSWRAWRLRILKQVLPAILILGILIAVLVTSSSVVQDMFTPTSVKNQKKK